MIPVATRYRVKDSTEFRVALLRSGFKTVRAFQQASGLSRTTVAKMLKGLPIRPETVNIVAEVAKVDTVLFEPISHAKAYPK